MKRFLVVALVLAAGCPTGPGEPSLLPQGSWGGEHLLMTVSDTGAVLEFDCATGTIAPPMRVEGDGHFSWAGTFTLGHGGPIRIDETPDVRPATYTGTLSRDKLTVEMNATGIPAQKYEVYRGQSGRVFKCL